MEGIFQTILRMSLQASVVILAVLLGRLALRRAPKRWSYVLWAAVGFRLACPVSVLWAFSLFRLLPGLTSPGGTGMLVDYAPLEVSTAPAAPQITQNLAPQVSIPASVPTAPTLAPEETLDLVALLWKIGTALWLLGLAVMLLAALWQYLRLRRQLVGAVQVGERIYETDRIPSPFILGLLPPKIYLPLGLEGQARSYVLSHERYHIRHLDPAVRLVAYGLLSIHWFNPLVWLAFRLMGRDMELRCDEAVMQQWGGGADYSRTLLQVATQGRFPGPAPLAFGETDVKTRIKNALNWKKPTIWVSLAALALCAALVAVCVTNPGGKRSLEELLGVPLDQVTHVEAQTIVGRFADGKLQNDRYQLTLEGEEAQALLAILERASFRQKLRFQSTFENMEAHADLWLTGSDGPLGWCGFVDGVMNLEGKSYKLDPAITAELQDYIVEHGQKQENTDPTADESQTILSSGTYYLERTDESISSYRFWIRINTEKGSFQYYETPISSYIGLGLYQLEGDVLTISDGLPTTEGTTQRVNRFRVGDGKLTWIAEGSDGFLFAKLQNGDIFTLGPDNGEFLMEPEPLDPDISKYQPILEECAQREMDAYNKSSLENIGEITGFEIVQFQRADSFPSPEEARYTVYQWDAAFTLSDPDKVFLAGGVYLDSAQRLRRNVPGVFVVDALTGEFRFLVEETFSLSSDDAASRQNTWNAILEAFDVRRGTTPAALPDLSDVSGWAQLDPGDPRIHVSAPHNLDLREVLTLLREGED
ncbi:MAG: hypothetical protein IKS29_08990, partial [Oscillospiraceae bacterium]|nr:hypothetical protein [Oscillospiraceae bacterium]